MRHRERALKSLDVLSFGDAFGAAMAGLSQESVQHRTPPAPAWRWTANTLMTSAVVRVLGEHLEVDEPKLLAGYIERYVRSEDRAWSDRLRGFFDRVRGGGDPVVEAKRGFEQGSCGSVAGIVGAPVGAFFAEHPARAADEARKAAQVTHRHPDGAAGAIACAVAAAYCTTETPSVELFSAIDRFLPAGRVKDGCAKVSAISRGKLDSVRIFGGSGSAGTAADTVPTALWFAAHYGTDVVDAMWRVAQMGGDTTMLCAILGGVLGGADPLISPDLAQRREALSGEFAAWGLT